MKRGYEFERDQLNIQVYKVDTVRLLSYQLDLIKPKYTRKVGTIC